MINLTRKLKLFIYNRIIRIELVITFVIIIVVSLLSICNHYFFNNKIESVVTSTYSKPIITPVTTIPRDENLISRGGNNIREVIKNTTKPEPVSVSQKVYEEKKNVKKETKTNKITNKNVNFKYVDSGIYYITMYTLAYDECGKNPWDKYYGFGSSGIKVRPRESVAMGKSIPYNTKIKIEGFENIYTNHDTGSRIYNNCVDVFTNNLTMSNKFGRQKRRVWILSWGNGKVK